MTNPDKCIINNFGGKPHPYSHCIIPSTSLVDPEKVKQVSSSSNMAGMAMYMAAIVQYAEGLVTNSAPISECRRLFGNKYFLKTNIPCSNYDENVHVYINNVVEKNPLTGVSIKKSPMGMLPAIVGSAAQINGVKLVKGFIDDPNKKCIKVKLPCHIIDENNKKNNVIGTDDNEVTPQNYVPITCDAYNELKNNPDIKIENDTCSPNSNDNSDGFTNLYESIYNYLDQNPQFLNIKNTNQSVKEVDNSNRDLLFDLYYLSLSIFCLFLLFKLMNKK